ncbi:MAG TPA: ABC transporter ATP-binding protein [Acidimicrobiales bacterium]|nr:ABC transporter ATP-binding protein [Acidimicrobiales bacterium]
MPLEGAASYAGAPALEVDGVCVNFGGVAALTDVCLRADAGVVTGLIGPNGAGKTTLFNVITGLQRPDHGVVRLGGVDVTRKRTHRRARLGLSRTFQRLELFSTLNAADNVRVGLEAARGGEPSAAVGLLERVGVGNEAASPVSSLPTGSARLVELARALSTDPKVLLLDEPSSGLDDRETQALGILLGSLAAEGRAVVLVEHDTDLVMRVCEKVFVLDFGEVIAVGTPAEVRRNAAVQEAYLGHVGETGAAGERA